MENMEATISNHSQDLERGNEESNNNRVGKLLFLLIAIFSIHIILFTLFEFEIFPGFSFNLILFAISFAIISLLLYSIKKEYFFKLSVFFSMKVIFLIVFFYILMLIITTINTMYSISNLKKDIIFKNNFPTTKLDYDYKNFLTLRNIVIAQSPIDYKLDNELEKKLEILKQFNIAIELHFTKEEDNKEFLMMLAYYPDFIYKESTKLFFAFVLYLYLFATYWLLANYLQKDARVKHTVGVFALLFPIYFIFFAFSGAFHNSSFPIIIESNKRSIMRIIIDAINENKEWGKNISYIQGHSSSPIRIENLYIKIILRSKK